MKASRLAPRPNEAKITAYEQARSRWPRYVPRSPKVDAGELLIQVERPMHREETVYRTGDYLPIRLSTVVPPEGWQSDAHPGIVADWWEEHGQPLRAALIRGCNVVVCAAGKALCVSLGQGMTQRLQYLVVRLASAKDDEAIAAQKAAKEERTRSILDRAANS